MATRDVTVRVRCSDGSIPSSVYVLAKAVIDPRGGDGRSEGGSGVATVRLLRDVAYSITIQASVPSSPANRFPDPEVLRVVDLEAGSTPAPMEIVASRVKCGPPKDD